jgi:hypothetical protein
VIPNHLRGQFIASMDFWWPVKAYSLMTGSAYA